MILSLDQILEAIYGSGKDNKDFAAMIRQIATALDDSFYEEQPTPAQYLVLKKLDAVAKDLESFYEKP